jgi:hypothetical protein
MSNNTMATVSNLYLARDYLIFVKFDLLTAMIVKVLASAMWTFCFHFQGRKIKKDLVFSSETLKYLTDLHGMKYQKKIHIIYSCAVFHAGCVLAMLRAKKTATFRKHNLYSFLENYVLLNRLGRTFWP